MQPVIKLRVYIGIYVLLWSVFIVRGQASSVNDSIIDILPGIKLTAGEHGVAIKIDGEPFWGGNLSLIHMESII